MTEEQTKAKAQAIWNAFNDSEKHGVHFALFPAAPMQAAEKEGYDGHKLVVALMEVAKDNPPRQQPYVPKPRVNQARRFT